MAEIGIVTRFWSRLRAAFQATYEDNCFAIAKGAAYSSLLAFFPVITTVAAVLLRANAEAVARTTARLLYDVIPPGTEEIVRALFTVQGRRPTALLVGAVVVDEVRTGSLTHFNLSMGVDERGVELSPDSLALPAYVNQLPQNLIDAANRVRRQKAGTYAGLCDVRHTGTACSGGTHLARSAPWRD